MKYLLFIAFLALMIVMAQAAVTVSFECNTGEEPECYAGDNTVMYVKVPVADLGTDYTTDSLELTWAAPANFTISSYNDCYIGNTMASSGACVYTPSDVYHLSGTTSCNMVIPLTEHTANQDTMRCTVSLPPYQGTGIRSTVLTWNKGTTNDKKTNVNISWPDLLAPEPFSSTGKYQATTGQPGILRFDFSNIPFNIGVGDYIKFDGWEYTSGMTCRASNTQLDTLASNDNNLILVATTGLGLSEGMLYVDCTYPMILPTDAAEVDVVVQRYVYPYMENPIAKEIRFNGVISVSSPANTVMTQGKFIYSPNWIGADTPYYIGYETPTFGTQIPYVYIGNDNPALVQQYNNIITVTFPMELIDKDTTSCNININNITPNVNSPDSADLTSYTYNNGVSTLVFSFDRAFSQATLTNSAVRLWCGPVKTPTAATDAPGTGTIKIEYQQVLPTKGDVDLIATSNNFKFDPLLSEKPVQGGVTVTLNTVRNFYLYESNVTQMIKDLRSAAQLPENFYTITLASQTITNSVQYTATFYIVINSNAPATTSDVLSRVMNARSTYQTQWTNTMGADSIQITSAVATYPDTCYNGSKDTGEAGVDCGGDCPLCPAGSNCTGNSECATGICERSNDNDTSGICEYESNSAIIPYNIFSMIVLSLVSIVAVALF